jgi:hypothetical protein
MMVRATAAMARRGGRLARTVGLVVAPLLVTAALAVAAAPDTASAAAGTAPAASGTAPAAAGVAPMAAGYRVVRLPLPAGATAGEVRATDGAGRWVGIAGGPGYSGAVVWANGKVSALGPGRAQGVNRHGVVVGGDSIGTNMGHAVLWRGGRRIRLAEPRGTEASSANAVDDAGNIVGFAGTATRTYGMVWSAATPGRYRTLPYRDRDVNLLGVSAGRIVGGAWPPRTEGETSVAVEGTVRQGLRAIAGPGSAAAAAAGGFVTGGVGTEARLWRWGSTTAVRTRAGFIAMDVNTHGAVCGIDTAAGYLPALWTRTGVRHLPLLPGWHSASPSAMDDAGRVGGAFTGPGPSGPPVLWVP